MGWKLAAALAGALSVVGLLLGAPVGALDDVVVSGDDIEAAESDDGGWTTEVGLSNIGETKVDLTFEVDEDDQPSGCAITATPSELDARRSRSIKLTIPEGCADDGNAPDLRLSIGTSDLATLNVVTKESDDLDLALIACIFGASLLGAWVFALLVRRGQGATTLPGLPEDWDFKESWATNVGLGGAIFTGVLGTGDVLEKIIGDGSEAAVADAVVAAAVTAGLIGAAPLLIAATAKKEGARRVPTSKGFILAFVVVVGANLGQIATMAWLLMEGDQVPDLAVASLAVIAVAVLIWYAARSARATLEDGAATPEPDKPSDPAGKLGAALLELAGIEAEQPRSTPTTTKVASVRRLKAVMV